MLFFFVVLGNDVEERAHRLVGGGLDFLDDVDGLGVGPLHREVEDVAAKDFARVVGEEVERGNELQRVLRLFAGDERGVDALQGGVNAERHRANDRAARRKQRGDRLSRIRLAHDLRSGAGEVVEAVRRDVVALEAVVSAGFLDFVDGPRLRVVREGVVDRRSGRAANGELQVDARVVLDLVHGGVLLISNRLDERLRGDVFGFDGVAGKGAADTISALVGTRGDSCHLFSSFLDNEIGQNSTNSQAFNNSSAVKSDSEVPNSSLTSACLSSLKVILPLSSSLLLSSCLIINDLNLIIKDLETLKVDEQLEGQIELNIEDDTKSKKQLIDEHFEKVWKELYSTPYDKKKNVTKDTKTRLYDYDFETDEVIITYSPIETFFDEELFSQLKTITLSK